METEILLLHLASPIYCVPMEGLVPFDCPTEPGSGPGEEKIFCFELNEAQRLAFEPDKNKLFGNLIFSGAAANGEGKTEIPAGDYLFTQKRETLNREEIISLAVEIQQEGLWRRLVPGERLFLRFLHEDGSWVTQLLRPYIEPGTIGS